MSAAGLASGESCGLAGLGLALEHAEQHHEMCQDTAATTTADCRRRGPPHVDVEGIVHAVDSCADRLMPLSADRAEADVLVVQLRSRCD